MSNGLPIKILSLLALGPWVALCGAADPLFVPEIPFESLQFRGEQATLTIAAANMECSAAQILVADGVQPVGVFQRQTGDGVTATFQCDHVQRKPSAAARCRAWRIGCEPFTAARREWPQGAERLAIVDSVGPGAQTGWLSLGSTQGFGSGDTFWLLRNGQPLLTARIVHREADLAFVRFTTLAEGARAGPGDVMRLWPNPFDQSTGRAKSAVCFVEGGQAPILWIAGPPGVAVPTEPRVDLFRAGEYVGHAIVQRWDERFWYARPLQDACTRTPQVGDVALIRTAADVRARRFTARVFDHTEDGYLITASDADGLKPDELATAFRGEQELGLMRVTRVQGGYAAIQPVASGGEKLRNLDEITFRPRTPTAAPLGSIEAFVADNIFTLRLTRANQGLSRPFAIQRGDETIGAGVLVASEGTTGLGVVWPHSQTGAIQVGDTISTTR